MIQSSCYILDLASFGIDKNNNKDVGANMSKLHPYRSLRPLFWTIVIVWLAVLLTAKLIQSKEDGITDLLIAANAIDIVPSHVHVDVLCDP